MEKEVLVGDLTQLHSDVKQDSLKLDRRQTLQIKGAGENLLTVIGSFAEPCTEKHLLKIVRGRKQYKVAALRILHRDGKIFRIGSGKKGDPFLYFTRPLESKKVEQAIVEEIII